MSQLDGAEVNEEEDGLRRTLCTLKIITKFSNFFSCHLCNFSLSQQETESSHAKLKDRIFKYEDSEKRELSKYSESHMLLLRHIPHTLRRSINMNKFHWLIL